MLVKGASDSTKSRSREVECWNNQTTMNIYFFGFHNSRDLILRFHHPHFKPPYWHTPPRVITHEIGWWCAYTCCVHNASTVPWTSAGQFGRPRGVRGRPWYDLWRPRCVISHPMDVRGLPPRRPPSGRPRDTQFGIDWSLLPSGCPQGVRTAEVQPITARTHYGQEVGLPTVRPKPEVDVP